MKNARKEFEAVTLFHISKVKCAYIKYGDGEDDEHCKVIKLKVGYSQKDYENFLKSLDFQYDNGLGSQELFGYIWINDGTWYERGEYDGSEWWEYKSTPPIPETLNK